jgi:transposase
MNPRLTTSSSIDLPSARCSLELDDSCADGAPLRKQTFELPSLAPVVTEHRLLACRCSGCGHVTRAASPIKPGATRYGPNLLGLIGYLNVCLQTSRRATLDFLERYIGVPTSLGTIQKSLEALIYALSPA